MQLVSWLSTAFSGLRSSRGTFLSSRPSGARRSAARNRFRFGEPACESLESRQLLTLSFNVALNNQIDIPIANILPSSTYQLIEVRVNEIPGVEHGTMYKVNLTEAYVWGSGPPNTFGPATTAPNNQNRVYSGEAFRFVNDGTGLGESIDIPIRYRDPQGFNTADDTMHLTFVPESYLPQITTQPKFTSITVGDTATLNVGATSTQGAVSYQWYQGISPSGTLIDGATSSSYTTDVFNATGQTNYYVRLTNNVGSVYSQTATVNVAVETTTQATDTTVFYHDDDFNAPLDAKVTSAELVDIGKVDFKIPSLTGIITTYSGNISDGKTTAQYVVPGGSAPGVYAIEAEYVGPADLASSTDNTKKLTIDTAPTTVGLTAPTTVYGDKKLGVTVASLYGVPQGTVSLSIDGQTAVDRTLSAGATVFQTPLLSAGVHSWSATYAAQGNFKGSVASGTFTVLPAPITVTANNFTRPYAAANPTFTYKTSGFAVAGDSFTGSLATLANTTSNAGDYDITQGTLDNPNYAITYIKGTLHETKRHLTVKPSGQVKSYGASNPTLSYTFSGFVNGEDATSAGIVGAPVLATTVTKTTVPGTYAAAITVTSVAGLESNNYDFIIGTAANFVVTKAVLTVTPAAKTRVFGAANPALTYQFSGFVNGQNATSAGVSGSAALSTAVTTASGAQTYARIIKVTSIAGLSAANYSFQIGAAADFTVTKAVLVVTPNAQTRVYGAANPSLTYTFSGFVNGQTLATAGIAGTATLATAVTATSNVQTYARIIKVTSIAGLSAKNYSFAIGAPADFTVKKSVLIVSADAKTRVYGAANPALTFKVTGFANGQNTTTAGVTGSATLATAVTAASNVQTYDRIIKVTSVAGLAAKNYSFQIGAAASFTVTKAVLIVTPNNQTRIYGAVNPALTYKISGFVNGQTAATAGIAGTAVVSTAVNANSNAQTYSRIIKVTSVAGLTAKNYSFQIGTAANFTVNKALLIVTPDAKTRVYGSANPTLTYRFSGFANGQTAATAGISGTATVATTVTSRSNAQTYARIIKVTSVSGLTAKNYSFQIGVAADLTVTKANLTVTASNLTKIVGQVLATARFTGTIQGLVSGDTIVPVFSCPTGNAAGAVAGTYQISISLIDANHRLSNYNTVLKQGTLTVKAAASGQIAQAAPTPAAPTQAAPTQAAPTLAVRAADVVFADPKSLAVAFGQ